VCQNSQISDESIAAYDPPQVLARRHTPNPPGFLAGGRR
jgi:hypothetical protein